MLFQSGSAVEQHDLGSGNQGSTWIGDQSANAASTGLSKRNRTSTQQKNPNRKKIPHDPETIIFAIQRLLPKFIRRYVVMFDATVLSVRTTAPLSAAPGTTLPEVLTTVPLIPT